MMKIFKTILFTGLLALIANGCSSMQVKDQTQVTINTSDSQEDCVELLPGHGLYYSFKTSNHVDFNIHYHEGKNIVYPVSKKNISIEDGKFYPDKEQFYCLMWTNTHSEPVNLTYTFRGEKK